MAGGSVRAGAYGRFALIDPVRPQRMRFGVVDELVAEVELFTTE